MELNRYGQPRVRVAHKKSRRGCTACKQRRTRCDEEKPLCLACLRYGTHCVYLPVISRQASAKQKTAEGDPSKRSLRDLLPATPADPFDVLPVKMTYRSSELFHHFMDDRIALARLASQDVTAFNASIGLAHTDSTWFQLMLCISASYRSLRDPTDFQRTFLFHRQGLLGWLQGNLDKTAGAIPAAYLSVVASMAMIDTAACDDASAGAHLSGMLTLLDARRQYVKEWQFYDELSKRIMLMTMCLLFLMRQIRVPAGPYSRDGLDPMLAAIYSQIVNEFIRSPVLTGMPSMEPRMDGPILALLDGVLSELKRRRRDWQSALVARGPKRGKDAELRVWLKSAGAYALTVGAFDWSGTGRPGGTSPRLNGLREWWSDIIEDWIATGKPMTHSIARRVVEKLKWVESDEGVALIHEIAVSAQCDGVHRVFSLTSQDDMEPETMNTAPGLLYI